MKLEKKFRALGTDIYIQAIVDRELESEKLLGQLEDLYGNFERIFSRFDPESELGHLNGNLGQWLSASGAMIEVAEKCLGLYVESGGVFDPRIIDFLEGFGYRQDFKKNDFDTERVPADFSPITEKLSEDLKTREGKIFFGRRMDFAGIAKGYITDRVAEFLQEKGVPNFFIDSGGDIFALGRNEEEEDWRVSLEGVPEEKILIKISGASVATSGITRRKWEIGEKVFHHLINPANPYQFETSLKSVSAFGEDAERADFLAKILFLSGKEEGIKKANQENWAAIFLDYQSRVFITKEAKKFLTQPL